MSTYTERLPNGLNIGFLQSQGGKVSQEKFYGLIDQLIAARSLDHVSPLPASLGEFDVVYVILRRGSRYDLDEEGNRIYIHITDEDGYSYWLAGFGCLVFPASRHRRDSATSEHNSAAPGDTANISISLLPEAQRQGYGRMIVQKLIKHAFDTLRIPRVTASIICPVQPSHSTTAKKQVVYNTKQLCWIFEKFGFKFEGVTRGAVPSTRGAHSAEPAWHDVHRMSMLQTDYFKEGRSYLLSHTRPFHDEVNTRMTSKSPWENMVQRQKEEEQDMKLWAEKVQSVSVNDACENEDSDSHDSDDTVLGDDAGSDDWDMTCDYDD